MSVIAARDIGIAFGGVVAVDGVSFSAAAGEVLSIIGPNGAGKTTLFNVVSGLYRAGRGRVTLDGEDVTGRSPEILAAKGLSRTFQNLQLFTRMTTCENVMVGRHLRERRSLAADLLRLPSVRRQNRETRAAAAGPPRLRAPWRARRHAGERPALRRPESAWRSPAPLPRSRRRCSSTSRLPAATRSRPKRSSG